MSTLLDVDRNAASILVRDLVNKASGVFLWVIRACRSLRVGLAAGDRVSELQARLDALPTELKDVFVHILNKIEPTYRSQATKLLRICYTSQLSTEPTLLMTLGFAIADEYDMNIEHMPDFRNSTIESKLAKCENFERRLRSRTWGLLEVERGHSFSSIFTQNWPTKALKGEPLSSLLDSHVVFLHRTLFEFLNTPGVWNLECFRIQDREFDPNTAICCISLHLADICLENGSDKDEQCIHNMLYYACQADKLEPVSHRVELVLDRLVQRIESEYLVHSPSFEDPGFANHAMSHFRKSPKTPASWPSLLLAVELGMVNFVKSFFAIKSNNPLDPAWPYPLLCSSVVHPFLSGFMPGLRETLIPSPLAMMDLLISIGCDPGEEFSYGFFWR